MCNLKKNKSGSLVYHAHIHINCIILYIGKYLQLYYNTKNAKLTIEINYLNRNKKIKISLRKEGKIKAQIV